MGARIQRRFFDHSHPYCILQLPVRYPSTQTHSVRGRSHSSSQPTNSIWDIVHGVYSFRCILTVAARPGSLARHLHFHRRPCLRLVSLIHGHSPLHLLSTPQHCFMAKDPAVPSPPRLSHLHHHSHSCSTLLDRRSLVQLQLLQRARVRRQCAYAAV